MKTSFLLVLLLSAFALADERFTAKFEMVVRKGSDGPIKNTILSGKDLDEHKAENGVYTGTMNFFSNDTASYREMIFDNIGVTEVYAKGIPVIKGTTNEKQEAIFAKTTTCESSSCSYSEMRPAGSTTTFYNRESLSKSSYDASSDYIVAVENSSGTVTAFMTQDNIIYLTNVRQNGYTPPQDFFGNCITRTCSISLDMVFALDISGSMSSTDISNAHYVIKSIANMFKLGTDDSSSGAAMIKWNDNAYLSNSASKSYTLDYFMSNGFIKGSTEFVSAVSNAKGGGNTCLSCGYKATIETSYTQYIYEETQYDKTKKHPEVYGRLGLVITDGYPNYNFRQQKSSYQFTVKKGTATYKWNKYNNYYSSQDTLNDIDLMKTNAKEFYSKYLYGSESSERSDSNNDYVKFFQRLTILALGVNAAGKGTTMDQLFTKIGQKGPVTADSFSTFYKISDLKDENKQKEFFNDLSSNICTGYQGILTGCKSVDRPCCGTENKCGKCEQFHNPCQGKEGVQLGNCNCKYVSNCTIADECKEAKCDNTKTGGGACTITDKPLEIDEIKEHKEADSCFVYQCKSGKGRNLDPIRKIDCNKLIKEKLNISCVVGATCQTGNPSYTGEHYKPEDKLEKDDVEALCKYAFICGGSKCRERVFIGGEDDDRTKEDNYSDEAVDRSYYEENCYDYTCDLKKSETSNEYEQTPHDCKNICQKCEYSAKEKKNNCVDIGVGDCQDPMANPYSTETGEGFDPSIMFEGCSILPTCDSSLNDNKGGCTKNIDMCAQNSTICVPLVCNKGLDEDGNPLKNPDGSEQQASCEPHPIQCTMPMYYDTKCYSTTCVDDMGGCLIVVDYDKLNACGECSDFDTCDESTVVVAATISAGVVAGIVIAAVVALSVGLVASKKMYDMITGAQEASMDTAQENALYQSDEKGGDNPLFKE